MHLSEEPAILSGSRVILGLTLWSMLWAGCSQNSSLQGKLEEAIRSAADSEQKLRIEDSTDFAWDELYVIGPYASEEDVPEHLRSAMSASFRVSTQEESLLLFVRERKIVTSFHLPHQKGNFLPNPTERFAREEASFYVRTEVDGSFALRPHMR